jgi:serine phosphatase RsbU (regulator of sigma subunit)
MKNFISIYLKFRPKLLIGFSVAMVALALLDIYFVLEVRVTSNDECLWITKNVSRDSAAIYFDVVKVEGVTWNAGIRNGDQLLEINNQKLLHGNHAQTILNKVKSGDYAEYVVKKKNGSLLRTNVYVKKLIEFGHLSNALSGLFWMLIGFIVLTAKPDGKPHKLFYAMGVFAVFSSTQVLLPVGYKFFDYVQAQPFFALLIGCIWIIGVSFIGPTMLLFFWNFPQTFKFAEKVWVKRLLFIIPFLFAVFLIVNIILTFGYKIMSIMYYYSILNSLGIVMLVVTSVAMISLIIQYRKLKNKEQRKPVLIILVAFAFGIAIAIYSSQIAPAIADSFFNSPEYFAPIVLIALVPLFFAYAIFRYQLMDVSVVIRNTIMYGAATLTLAAIYFFVVYVAGKGISSVLGMENQGIVAGIFFIIFAIIFQSTKNKFQDFLTKRFYPEQFAHQRVLMDLSNELATVVGLDNILDLMNETFVDALKIHKFGILIRDKNGTLSLCKSVGISDNECIVTNTNISVFLKEKSVLTDHPAIEQTDFKKVLPDMSDRLIKEDVHTIIPMIVKNKLVGLLLFGLKRSGSCFAGKDIQLLWAAANQAAVSIENARLYESEAQKIKIDRDLDLARKIQESLLPACIPQIKNLDICGEMIPAMQVGGDYFDLLPVNNSESQLFVVIGDVSGKGLSASLYMTKLQTMIKFACTEGRSPKDILIEINRRIFNEIERNWFITMSVAYFDLEKNIVKFCRAGHMPLLTANNGMVESYRTQGIGVGLEKGEIFDRSLMEEEIKLKRGQIYAFYTDGVTEAMNENNDLFGEENLSTILKDKSNARSSDIVNEIWSSVQTFRGEAEVNDDMTMVVVKVK